MFLSLCVSLGQAWYLIVSIPDPCRLFYFVGRSLSLRKALWVAMATMHFHIAQTGLFMSFFFCIQGVPQNSLTPIKNCPWGAR